MSDSRTNAMLQLQALAALVAPHRENATPLGDLARGLHMVVQQASPAEPAPADLHQIMKNLTSYLAIDSSGAAADALEDCPVLGCGRRRTRTP
jgi:hypothetical protein